MGLQGWFTLLIEITAWAGIIDLAVIVIVAAVAAILARAKK